MIQIKEAPDNASIRREKIGAHKKIEGKPHVRNIQQITMDTTRNPKVRETLNVLKTIVPFGFMDKNNVFIQMNAIQLDNNNNCKYVGDDGSVLTVSRKIKEVIGIPTARWLNHLMFKDGYGNYISFKKYLTDIHSLQFS